MKKNIKRHYKKFRAEIALVMAAVFLITSAFGLQMFVFANDSKTIETDEAVEDTPSNTVLVLEGGPEYRLNDNAWEPQLTIAAATPIKSQNEFDRIKFNLKLADISTIKSCFSQPGSCSSLDGQPFTYNAAKDLGIYFTGTKVSSVGVTQENLFKILTENEEQLAKGETITVTLPISGAFTDDGEITGISIMLAHDSTAGILNDLPISISDFEFKIASEDNDAAVLYLADGPDYTFNANAWDPQLVINAKKPFATSSLYLKIKFDIKLEAISTIKSSFTGGSRSSLGGGEFSYNSDIDLGIYFTGTDVTGIGVTQNDMFDVLNQAEELLAKGETATVTMPISGTFTDGGEITGVSIMPSHGDFAAVLADVPVSISDITFLKEGEEEHADNELVLKGGPSFILTNEQWNPQLNIPTESFVLPATTGYMQLEIAVSDIDTVLDNFAAGSRSTLGGGEFSYDFSRDLGIYFSGTNVTGIGVTQENFKTALNAARDDLLKGKHVVLELPVSGDIEEGAIINELHFMVSFKELANAVEGIEFNIPHLTFSDNKTVEEPVVETLNETNMLSNSKKVAVAFAGRKIYVVEKTTVGDLLNAITLPDGFKKMVVYEDSRISNKSKAIEDYDYVFIVTDADGNQTKFPVIPCKAKSDGSVDILKQIPNNKNVTAIEDEEDPTIEDTDYQAPDSPAPDNNLSFNNTDNSDNYNDYDDNDGMVDQTVQQVGGTKKNVKKYQTTENMPLYPTVQLIVMMALSMLAGAAIMFIVDLFCMKKIAIFKKKNR